MCTLVHMDIQTQGKLLKYNFQLVFLAFMCFTVAEKCPSSLGLLQVYINFAMLLLRSEHTVKGFAKTNSFQKHN